MRRTRDGRNHWLGMLMTVFVMCVMFMCISTNVLAAQGKVTCDPAAKIRENASTGSTQVGSAKNGTVLDIVDEVTASDGKVWYKVSFDGGKTGYIRSDLMQKLPEANPPSTVASEVTDVQPINCTVTGNQVNVRSNASTSGDKVAQVRKDEVMTINGVATDSEGKTWYRVSFTSDNRNVTGYVRYDFVSVSGEIKPVEQQPDLPPVVDHPVETPPVQETPIEIPSLSKDYDTAYDEGIWYLIDNVESKRYNLENVMDAAIKNPQIYDEIEGKVKRQSGWITFLVILVLLMAAAIVVLVLKVKDVMDEAYFSAVEKQTMRQRQGQGQRPAQAQRSGNPPQKRNVMHTVGANGGNAQRPGAPAGQGVPKMNITNPADTKTPKPVSNRPVQQSPVMTKPIADDDTKVMKPVIKQESTSSVDPSKQKWQSKNFMTDDEDDMEYGFLDWEEGDE